MTQGAIDAQGLHRALEAHRQTGKPLGRALLQNALCPPAKLWSALAQQLGLTFVSLQPSVLERAPGHLLPEAFASQERVLPLWSEEKAGTDLLIVGTTRRVPHATLLAAERYARRSVEPRLISDDDFAWALQRLYSRRIPTPASPSPSTSPGRRTPHAAPSHGWERPTRLLPKRQGELLLHGWPRAAAAGLVLLAASEGCRARPASSAALAASHPEDLALLSVRDAERLAAYGIFPAAKLILTSTEPERERSRARRLGASELLDEPIHPDAFVQLLRAAWARN